MHIWMVSLSTLRSFWGKKINALHPFLCNNVVFNLFKNIFSFTLSNNNKYLVFATNSVFLIPISLQHNVVELRYFKL